MKITREATDRIEKEVPNTKAAYCWREEQFGVVIEGTKVNKAGDDRMLIMVVRGYLAHEYYKLWAGEPSSNVPKKLQERYDAVVKIIQEEDDS